MSPKPDVSEERMAQILDAAMTEFSEHGFEKARMEDISERAGISKATVYLYFKSKEALIGAIMEHLFSSEMAALQVLGGKQDSARLRLARFIEALVGDLSRMRPLMPILYEFYALGLRKEPVRRLLGAFYKRFIDMVAPVIQEGIDGGEFCSTSARQAAIALGAIMEGTLLLWAFAPEQMDLEMQLRRGFELVISGLCQTTKGEF